MMPVTTSKPMRIGLLMAAVSMAGACTNSNDMEARLDTLETKVNQALQNSAAAKVDATTALAIATETQSQNLEAKVNQALRDSAAAKIDATTALDVSLKGQ